MTTDTPPKFSWEKRAKSFKYAFNGIKYLLKTQHNAWIHSSIAITVILAGIWFQLSILEWSVIAISIGGVFMAEAFNTAIELLADKITTSINPIIGKAKDVAAGAVLIFAMATVAVGLLIFIPKIF